MKFFSGDADGVLDLNEPWTIDELRAEAKQLHLAIVETEPGKLKLGGRVFASADIVDMYVDEMHHFIETAEVVPDWLGQDSADYDQWESSQ